MAEEKELFHLATHIFIMCYLGFSLYCCHCLFIEDMNVLLQM
jgi:hypothetical protein